MFKSKHFVIALICFVGGAVGSTFLTGSNASMGRIAPMTSGGWQESDSIPVGGKWTWRLASGFSWTAVSSVWFRDEKTFYDDQLAIRRTLVTGSSPPYWSAPERVVATGDRATVEVFEHASGAPFRTYVSRKNRTDPTISNREYKWLPIGVFCNGIFWGLPLYFAVFSPLALRRWYRSSRLKRGLCPDCAYPLLTSSQPSRCPECGCQRTS